MACICEGVHLAYCHPAGYSASDTRRGMSGDAKRFRALHGSAGRHGELFWTEEKDNVGLRLLRGMGWSQGQGLGKDGQGNVEMVKQKKRKDNAGIGANGATRDEAFRASQDLFNDVLARLSGGAGADGSGAGGADGGAPSALGSAATSVKGVIARRQISRRFCRAAPVKEEGTMDEILGRRSGGSGKGEGEEGTDGTKDELNQTTSGVSVADYFSRRRKELGLAEPSKSAAGSGFTLDDQANFATSQMAMSYDRRRGLGCGSSGADDDAPSRSAWAPTAFESAASAAAASVPAAAIPPASVPPAKDFNWKRSIKEQLRAAPGGEMRLKLLRTAVLAEHKRVQSSTEPEEQKRLFKKRLKKTSGVVKKGKMVRISA